MSLTRRSLGRAALLFGLGVVLVLISGLLPWLTATEAVPVADPAAPADGLGAFDDADTAEAVFGIDRVEWVVLAGLGLVAAGLVVTEPWSRVVLGVAGGSSLAALGVGAVYLFDPVWMYSGPLKAEIGAVTTVGPGVYLAVAGGLCQSVGSYLGVRGSTATGAESLDRPPEGEPHRPQQQRRQDSESSEKQPGGATRRQRSPEQEQRQKRE